MPINENNSMSNSFDFVLFRQQFPYFQQPDCAVYLDNAATSLKPQILIDATADFYASAGSVHRSQYDEKHTALYEQARLAVKKLLNAQENHQVIWTSGTTQSINLVANGLLPSLRAQDEIIISEAEHHANFVSWQQVAQKSGAKLHIIPIDDHWLIDEQALQQALNAQTKIVALNMQSNVTGTQQPIEKLVQLIRQQSPALILLDVAQGISHFTFDLSTLDVDFLAFSAHKIYGPTGLGVLVGNTTALELLQPLQYGGKMVDKVNKTHCTFSELPYRFEAGTPNIAAVIGFGAVLQWLQQWDFADMEQYCLQLAQQCKVRLQTYPDCQLFNAPHPSSVLSFVFKDIATSDLSTLLSEQNIALRAGQHCAQPYLARLGQQSTLRLSFAPYNQPQDIEDFFTALDRALELLA